MGPLEQAIENFCNKRHDVYKADPDQIIRDVHSAQRSANDHVGRWFFELLQNCDYAQADEVITPAT